MWVLAGCGLRLGAEVVSWIFGFGVGWCDIVSSWVGLLVLRFAGGWRVVCGAAFGGFLGWWVCWGWFFLVAVIVVVLSLAVLLVLIRVGWCSVDWLC